ncbi:MAG TPA: T9SS type A sorting domain-containing protein, partial [Bacteroidia bacterium]|nr:T9SS type A sorting domain-containing protein [Bacteroidia bacterium]
SVLLNGHYGTESTLTPGMKIDAGSGNAPYYIKSSPNFTGAVYAVCGVSGQGGSVSVQTSWPHAAMYSYANTLYGSMVIDFNADTLSAKFITSTGSIYDQFKIVKSGSPRFPINYFFDEEISGDVIVYPNPFNEALVVRYYLEKESMVSIQVSDLMGRIIYSDKNKDVQRAGVYEVHLKEDCIKSPSGIFVISVRTDAKIMNKKVEKIW